MHMTNHGSIIKYSVYLILCIFLLTGCRQGESDLEQDSSETQFQTTITDQKPTFKSPAFDENLVIDNMELLKSLCVCVPNFEDAEYLDEDFYARLINMSVCGPLGSRADIIISDGLILRILFILTRDVSPWTMET